MLLQLKPEDQPAAVRFHLAVEGGGLEVTCTTIPQQALPYRVLDGKPFFENSDAFKEKVVEAGMTPAVAEDSGRSFNATARQLMHLGFPVEVEKKRA